MSPWRPSVRGSTVWKAVTVGLAVGLAAVAYMGVGLYEDNHESIKRGKEALQKSNEAIRKNRRLGCHTGAFLVGIPIVKTPGTSQKTFEHSVAAAEGLLHDLKALDCKGLGEVTTASINKALGRLHKIVPEGGGSSTGNPHRSGSPTGGGPAAVGPSPQGQPPPPGQPPVPPQPPPTVPPPTTTTPQPPPPPPPPPGPVDRVRHLICNMLGVCIRR